MKVVALAGGTGSAKLLRGLQRLDIDLTVVANVGDNVWMYGVYVCPDIDVACYSLAGVASRERGWGVEGDTFEVLGALRRLGVETWFKLGDRDLGTCLARTELLRSGKTLTEACVAEGESLGLKCQVLPVTDDPLETVILTPGGRMGLQEFWVKEKGAPAVTGVGYRGSRRARLSGCVRDAVAEADRVVLCPANPVTSIGPMLAVPGFARLLSRSKARVSALSPMEGAAPFSGPAGKLLRAVGSRQDSVGVAELYRHFLDAFVISTKDRALVNRIEAMGIRCAATETKISGPADGARLARALLRA